MRTVCTECNTKFEVPASTVGKMGRCVKCKSVFRIQEDAINSSDRPVRSSSTPASDRATTKATSKSDGTVQKPTPDSIKQKLIPRPAIIVDDSNEANSEFIDDTLPKRLISPAAEIRSSPIPKPAPKATPSPPAPTASVKGSNVAGAKFSNGSPSKPNLVPKPAIIIDDTKSKMIPAAAIIIDESSTSSNSNESCPAAEIIEVEMNDGVSDKDSTPAKNADLDRSAATTSSKPRLAASPSGRRVSADSNSVVVDVVAATSKTSALKSPSPTLTSNQGIALDKWKDYSTEQKMAIIMRGFQAEFDRPRTSVAYRMGLAGATFVMMLLPVLYAAFIVATAYLVYLHVSGNVGIVTSVRGKAAIFALMIYVAPVIAGVLAVLFMLKPIFAGGFNRTATRSLSPEREPILFDFVRTICAEVGAPVPKRIDVNNEVNASASFRSGWWSILRGNDLVLTIGMPLVAGLNLQQLAGVLAHEFGHFSQGAGMRVSYVLRTVNHWFVRAVYERDSWDQWLEAMSKTLDIRIAWIFYFARIAVWFSRRFLWCLMSLGGLLTGIMQQQMEFDADRYEVAMSGKKTFAKTFNSLGRTAIAYQQSLDTLARILDEGKIVSNLPLLTKANLTKLKPETLKYLDEKLLHERTRRFDTHPCDRDRINAVSSQPDEGAYQSDLPARCVFLNYDAECIAVTKEMMVSILGKEALQKKVVDIKTVIAEDEEEAKAWEGLHRFFCNCITTNRAFFLPHYQLARVTDSTKALDLLKRARQATCNIVRIIPAS